MVNRNTLFILGAGASAPYGYPVGVKLRDIILDNLDSGKPLFRELIKMEYNAQAINDFRNAFRYSLQLSIDAFLEYNPKFMSIGKIAIAQAMIPYEKVDMLSHTKEGAWYAYFFSKILNTNFDNFNQNKVRIVTFNYDRSLEQALFIALKNCYGKNDTECANKLNNFEIIHIYGKLGFLPWQQTGGREYHPECSVKDLRKSAESIDIIYEGRNKDIFEKIQGILSRADNIFFLGFGYDQINFERLHIETIKESAIIWGTAFHMGQGEINRVQQYFKSFNKEIILHSFSVMDFLRNAVVDKLDIS